MPVELKQACALVSAHLGHLVGRGVAQCTVRGGREGRDIDAVELARAVEALGAGEILLNCIDTDGQCAAAPPAGAFLEFRTVLRCLLAAGVFQVALLGGYLKSSKSEWYESCDVLACMQHAVLPSA